MAFHQRNALPASFPKASKAYKLPPRGAALLLVLWLVAALSVAALVAASAAREHLAEAGMPLVLAHATARLDTALELSAQWLQRHPDPYYRQHEWRWGNERAWVEITPGTGLVHPINADLELRVQLLARAARLTHAQAQQRWQALAAQSFWPHPHAVADALRLPWEASVIIQNSLSWDGAARLDPRAVPPELMELLTEQPHMYDTVRQLLSEGIDPVATGLLDSALFAAPEVFSAPPGHYRLRARWTSPDGRRWRRDAWVSSTMRPDTRQPYTFVWVGAVVGEGQGPRP